MSNQYRENFYRGSYVDVNKGSAKLNNLFKIHHTGMYFVPEECIDMKNNFPINIKTNSLKPTYGFLEVLAQESLVYQRFTLIGVPEFPQTDSTLEEYVESKDNENEKGTTYFEAFGSASNYSEYDMLNEYRFVAPIKAQLEKAKAENKRTWIFERAGYFDGNFVTFKDWELLWDRKDDNMTRTHEFIKNHLIPKNITIPEDTFKSFEVEGENLNGSATPVEKEFPKSQGNLWFVNGGFNSIIPNPVAKVGGLERLSPQYKYLKENGINLIDDTYTDENGILTTNSIYNEYATLEDIESYYSYKQFNDAIDNGLYNVDNYGTIGDVKTYKGFETFVNKMKIPSREDSFYQERADFERKGVNMSYWSFPSIRNKKDYMEEMENIKTIKKTFDNQPLEIGNYYELPTEFAFRYLGRITYWSALNFKDMFNADLRKDNIYYHDLSGYDFYGQEENDMRDREDWFNNSYGKENFVKSIKSTKYINGYFVYAPTQSDNQYNPNEFIVPIKFKKNDFDKNKKGYEEINLSGYYVVLKVHTTPRRPYNNRPIYATEKTLANEFYTLYGSNYYGSSFQKTFQWYSHNFSNGIWGETYMSLGVSTPYNITGSVGYYQEYWNKFVDCERHMEILAYTDVYSTIIIPASRVYAYHLDRYENNINKKQRTNIVVPKPSTTYERHDSDMREFAVNPSYANWYRLSQPSTYQIQIIQENVQVKAVAYESFHTYFEFLISANPDKSAYYSLNEKMYNRLNLNNLFLMGTGYFGQRTMHSNDNQMPPLFGANYYWHEINSSNNFDINMNEYGEAFIDEITNYRLKTIENEEYLVATANDITGGYGSDEQIYTPFTFGDNGRVGTYEDFHSGISVSGIYNPAAADYNNTYKAKTWDSKERLKKEMNDFWLNKIITPYRVLQGAMYADCCLFSAKWDFDLVPEEEIFKDINPKELIQYNNANYIKIPEFSAFGVSRPMTNYFNEDDFSGSTRWSGDVAAKMKNSLKNYLYKGFSSDSAPRGTYAFVPLDMNKYFYVKFNEFMVMDNENNGFAVNYEADKKKIKTVYTTKDYENVAGKNNKTVKSNELDHNPFYSRKYYKVIKDGYLYLYRIYYAVPRIAGFTFEGLERKEPMNITNMKEYESFVKYMGINILTTAFYCNGIYPIINCYGNNYSYTFYTYNFVNNNGELGKNLLKYDFTKPYAVLYKKIKLDIKRYIPVSGGGKRCVSPINTTVTAKEYDDYDTAKF